MNYLKGNFRHDFFASIVVFLVALPLCMGIAIASGVPPALGIVTGIIGGVVVGVFSGAPLQVSGPAAGLTVLIFQIVQTHGIEMLGPIVLVAGALQIAAGFFNLGQWFRAVNPAVIHGMLGGIGLLIFGSQIHVMLGFTPHGSGIANLFYIPRSLYLTGSGFFQGLSETYASGVLGMGTILLMILWPKMPLKFLRRIPAPLVAVGGATVIALILKLPVQRVMIPDSFSSVLSFPSAELFLELGKPDVLSAVIGLALIASAETLLCASALTKMRSDAKVDYDKELFAQGIGNFLCGAVGCLPMTGVIVRSTANIEAGGQTRGSAVMHGIWLLVFVTLLPHILGHISMSSLAAVLVVTGYKLVNPKAIKNLSRYGKPALIIYFVTLVGIVVTDLLTGVLLGVVASLLRLIFTFSALTVKRTVNSAEKKVDLHLSGAATVITLPVLAKKVEGSPKGHRMVIHFKELFYIDHACMDYLETERLKRENTPEEIELDSSQLKFKYYRSEKRKYHSPSQMPVADAN